MLTLTLLAALFIPTDSKISMLDGQAHSGVLVAVTSTDVEITDNGANAKLPIDDGMVIELPATATATSVETPMPVRSKEECERR